MKMKKVSLFLSLILAVSIVLSACNNGPAASQATSQAQSAGQSQTASQEPVTITFSFWEGSPADKAGFETMIDKFEKENPNIKVTQQVVPYDKYWQSIDTRIAGSDFPDVTRLTYQKMGKYITGGVLQDITGDIDDATKNDLIPAFKTAVSSDDKMYGVPLHTDTMGLFYNKEMFEKAGITVPASIDKAWTWQEFIDNAKKLKSANNLQAAFSYAWTKNTGYRALPFLYMNGGTLFDPKTKKATVDDAKGVEWLNYIQSWVSEGLIAKTSPNATDTPFDLLCSGVIGMVIGGSSNVSYVDKNMKGTYGITYLPQNNGVTGDDMGGTALATMVNSKHKAEAIKFIQFLTNAEMMTEFDEATGFLPVRSSVSKSDMKFKDHPDQMKLFLEESQHIDPKMAEVEVHPSFAPMMNVISNSIEKIILNGQSGEDAAKEMAKGINDVFADEG